MVTSALFYLKSPKPLLPSIKHPETLAKIHALLILTGSLSHCQSHDHLISAYSRFNYILAARKAFETMPLPKTSSYNMLIIAYSRQNLHTEVLDLYQQSVSSNTAKPDSSTFTVALKACKQLSDLKSCEEIRTHVSDFGYEHDVFVCSSLVYLYAKCGKMEDALMVVDRMPNKDLVSWTSTITGYLSIGKPIEAIEVYREMKLDGIEGDWIVMISLCQACAVIGDSRMGLSIHGRLVRFGMQINIVVETSLVDMYAKNGLLERAHVLFNRMNGKNVVSWSALFSGYAQNGLASKPLGLLVEMQDCGFEPDSVALVSALLACSQFGFMKLGKSVHGFIVRRYYLEKISVTALIDMYSELGSLTSARALFDRET